MNHTPVTKMFVGGLREDTTEEMVRQTFSGHIKKVHIIRNRVTGKSRGFCFIDFDDPDDVDKHVCECSVLRLPGSPVVCVGRRRWCLGGFCWWRFLPPWSTSCCRSDAVCVWTEIRARGGLCEIFPMVR